MTDVMRVAPFVLGAISLGSLIAALFFARFYRDTRDALFLHFALAFALEAVNRALLAFSASPPNEAAPVFYILRAVSYTIILIGIYRKNQ
jgi:hypothetical protein